MGIIDEGEVQNRAEAEVGVIQTWRQPALPAISEQCHETPGSSCNGTIWHPSTASTSKGHAWIYTYARWGPSRCRDL